MRKIILLPCLFVSQVLATSSESLWSDIDPAYQFRSTNTEIGATTLIKARKLRLDSKALVEKLTKSSNQSIFDGALIELPLADGTQMLFKFEPSNVMAPELAARYPNIRAWRIHNPENPTITGRIDIGPQGFHGLINTADGDRIFIDPENNEDDTYISLSRRANEDSISNNFQCAVHKKPALQAKPEPTTNYKTLSNPASSLLTYRLAIATTGEYTQLFGGSKEDAMAAIVTTVNRLNQVYERDLSIHLQLIANNDNLIYTSPSSDPYSNENASAMVDENIINTNTVIGSENYDIGHVFGTGNTGGLAFIGSVCGTYKAGGVTGSNTPSGDAFNIDYVAHEIGHQLGASHTFNGQQLNCTAGNREANSAVEPGSGSSIMGYAGICGIDNLQSHSDAYFHSTSITQIFNHTRHNSSGSSCGTSYESTNNKPVVDAGRDYTIPAETSFVLTGITQDADEDPLIHSWEQIDTGSSSDLYTDLGDNPLFRVWPPVSSTSRFFPTLSSELTHTAIKGETLPTTTRSMNFKLLVRDNNGGIAEDQMQINVVNTGVPFSVTSQNNNQVLSAGQPLSVTWDVAGTNESPINCQSVSIELIENNGTTTELLYTTENDGAEVITVPSDIMSIGESHVKVACHDNIFYSTSNGVIQVLGGDPILSINSPSIPENNSGTHYLSFILTLSATPSENVIIDYEATTSGIVIKRGQTLIAKGSRNVSIQLPITGDTLAEENQIIELTIQKPSNAQFVTGDAVLSTQGLVIDDDTLAASPAPGDTTTQVESNNDSSGGGSIGLLSLLSLFLLAIRRQKLRIKQ